MSVSLPCEAPTFIVARLSLGLDAQQATQVLPIRLLCLLFNLTALLTEAHCFAEHVCLKAASEGQHFPDLLPAADAFQVPTPPPPFLGFQETVKTSRRILLPTSALFFSCRRLRSAATNGILPTALPPRLASSKFFPSVIDV